MKLYLVRHAEAFDIGEQGVRSDAERPLTEKGFRQASRVAGFLHEHHVRPDMVVSSPLLRARQTAERLAERLNPDTGVTVVDELTAGVDPETFMRAMRQCRTGSLIAVGHMPDLSYLAGALVTGSAVPLLDFKKAAVAAFEADDELRPGSAVLLWFVHPRILPPA